MAIIWVGTGRFNAYIGPVQDYIDRVVAADVAAGNTLGLEVGVRDAYDVFIRDSINVGDLGTSGGVLSQANSIIKAAPIMAGARTLAGALVPLVGAAPTNVGFVTGDYNRKTGLIGDGSSKYLNSNRNNNADPQDSQHMSVWVTTAATSTSTTYPVYIGVGPLAAGLTYIGRLNSNGVLYIRSMSSSYAEVQPGSAVGLLGVSRGSSDYFTTRVAGSSANHAITSQTPFNQNIIVFAANTDPGRPSNGRLAFYSIGESLDLALLDARVTALMNALAVAIP